jgi:hydrogenase maturation factor HypF (carbamoyltransferase family)
MIILITKIENCSNCKKFYRNPPNVYYFAEKIREIMLEYQE